MLEVLTYLSTKKCVTIFTFFLLSSEPSHQAKIENEEFSVPSSTFIFFLKALCCIFHYPVEHYYPCYAPQSLFPFTLCVARRHNYRMQRKHRFTSMLHPQFPPLIRTPAVFTQRYVDIRTLTALCCATIPDNLVRFRVIVQNNRELISYRNPVMHPLMQCVGKGGEN